MLSNNNKNGLPEDKSNPFSTKKKSMSYNYIKRNRIMRSEKKLAKEEETTPRSSTDHQNVKTQLHAFISAIPQDQELIEDYIKELKEKLKSVKLISSKRKCFQIDTQSHVAPGRLPPNQMQVEGNHKTDKKQSFYSHSRDLLQKQAKSENSCEKHTIIQSILKKNIEKNKVLKYQEIRNEVKREKSMPQNENCKRILSQEQKLRKKSMRYQEEEPAFMNIKMKFPSEELVRNKQSNTNVNGYKQNANCNKQSVNCNKQSVNGCNKNVKKERLPRTLSDVKYRSNTQQVIRSSKKPSRTYKYEHLRRQPTEGICSSSLNPNNKNSGNKNLNNSFIVDQIINVHHNINIYSSRDETNQKRQRTEQYVVSPPNPNQNLFANQSHQQKNIKQETQPTNQLHITISSNLHEDQLQKQKIADISTIEAKKQTLEFLSQSCLGIKDGLNQEKHVKGILNFLQWKTQELKNAFTTGKQKKRKYELQKLSKIFPKGFFQ